MMELLVALKDTSVPNVLVIAGIVFLLLAVAGRIGTGVFIPPERQRAAATIGVMLLISGIVLFKVPTPNPQLPSPNSTSSSQKTATAKTPPRKFQRGSTIKKSNLLPIRVIFSIGAQV